MSSECYTVCIKRHNNNFKVSAVFVQRLYNKKNGAITTGKVFLAVSNIITK